MMFRSLLQCLTILSKCRVPVPRGPPQPGVESIEAPFQLGQVVVAEIAVIEPAIWNVDWCNISFLVHLLKVHIVKARGLRNADIVPLTGRVWISLRDLDSATRWLSYAVCRMLS